MAQISLSLYVANDQGKVIEVEEHMSLAEIIPRLLQLNGTQDLSGPVQDQCTILISRRVEMSQDVSLNELGIRSGDAISLIVHVPTSSVTLLLEPLPQGRYAPIRIGRSGRILGRKDDARPGTQPDIDLSGYVVPPDRARKMSQQQAQLIEQDGVWSVQMVGRAPMFVNSERLVPNQQIQLYEGNVIAFGDTPNRPVLGLRVSFEAAGQAGRR